MLVNEVMTRNVSSCRLGNNLAELTEVMWNRRCGALPVLDDSGKVTGIITDRDICIALGTRNMRASEVFARDVAPPGYFGCGPDDDVRDALRTMATQEVSRLPVVDDAGKPVGMLSIDDITFRAACGSSSLNDREIIHAIAAIREDVIHEPDVVTDDRSEVPANLRMPMNYEDEGFSNRRL